jgi:hypothetical protein
MTLSVAIGTGGRRAGGSRVASVRSTQHPQQDHRRIRRRPDLHHRPRLVRHPAPADGERQCAGNQGQLPSEHPRPRPPGPGQRAAAAEPGIGAARNHRRAARAGRYDPEGAGPDVYARTRSLPAPDLTGRGAALGGCIRCSVEALPRERRCGCRAGGAGQARGSGRAVQRGRDQPDGRVSRGVAGRHRSERASGHAGRRHRCGTRRIGTSLDRQCWCWPPCSAPASVGQLFVAFPLRSAR